MTSKLVGIPIVTSGNRPLKSFLKPIPKIFTLCSKCKQTDLNYLSDTQTADQELSAELNFWRKKKKATNQNICYKRTREAQEGARLIQFKKNWQISEDRQTEGKKKETAFNKVFLSRNITLTRVTFCNNRRRTHKTPNHTQEILP